jgi:type VI secretion system protein ImpG
MRDELVTYFNSELNFLRQMGAEFKERYPKVASRLVLDPNKGEDPHVERMLEGFAFLAARVHLKIDDDFPEITEALLNILYPHYLRPIPSMTVAEFQMDPDQVKPEAGLTVGSGATLHSRPVDGNPCKFRTCYDVTFWPLAVADAKWTTPDITQLGPRAAESAGAVRLELRCHGDLTFSKLALSWLRFYLNGESGLVHTLYELLCNNCTSIVVRDASPKSKLPPVVLPPSALRPVGFEEDEALLPYSRRSFAGYRLLQEYFCFPEKFFFFDVHGLDQICRAGFGSRVEILFLFSPFEQNARRQTLERGISQRTFRLGCTPIVNLFPQTAEPVLLDHARYQYPVVPDVTRRHAMEVFSIDEVIHINPQRQETTRFLPFYAYRHGLSHEKNQTFWHAARRHGGVENQGGADVYLSLVDLSGRPLRPNVDVLTIETTCTNGDLPSRLPFGEETGDFQLQGAAPVRRITALLKPTPSLRPPVSRESAWRLISQLSLNYLSLVEEGKEALKSILRLYNFTGSEPSERQIEGILEMRTRRHAARLTGQAAAAHTESWQDVVFARGTRVEMTFDEEQFVGSGVYLFAAVIEAFLGLYVTMNSFTQLVAYTRQRRDAIRQWPPRAGRKMLL